jgi:hypothetical protein
MKNFVPSSSIENATLTRSTLWLVILSPPLAFGALSRRILFSYHFYASDLKSATASFLVNVGTGIRVSEPCSLYIYILYQSHCY